MNEIKKNFLILFRNKSSLALIILAPIFLILLAGFSFEEGNLKDIQIGVIHEGDITDLKNNVSTYATIHKYDQLLDCINQIKNRDLHLCIKITGFTNSKTNPGGQVIFVYDNSRERTSLMILSGLKEFFGLASEEITLISTTTIFENIQELSYFLNDGLDSIDDIKKESDLLLTKLVERKTKLLELKNQFTPKYLLVKTTHQSLTNSTYELISDAKQLNKSIQNVKQKINNYSLPIIQPTINITNTINTTAINLTSTINTTTINTTNLSATQKTNTTNTVILPAIQALNYSLDKLTKSTNEFVNSAQTFQHTTDGTITELDQINQLLETEIQFTTKYITLINESTIKISKFSQEAKNKLSLVGGLNSTLASKLARPINQEFQFVLPELTYIQGVFAVLLSTIIVFISILFANILTLMEINNCSLTRKKLAPVNDLKYTFGLFVTNMIIIFVQVTVLLIIAQLQFEVPILNNIYLIIIPLLTLMAIFVSMGMIIAFLMPKVQTSILMSTFVALTFYMLSDALQPLESMPKILSYIAWANPMVRFNEYFSKAVLFGLFSTIEFLYLLILFLISMILLIVVSKRRYAE